GDYVCAVPFQGVAVKCNQVLDLAVPEREADGVKRLNEIERTGNVIKGTLSQCVADRGCFHLPDCNDERRPSLKELGAFQEQEIIQFCELNTADDEPIA